MPSLKNTIKSPGLRYRNPTICAHLASQYVTGVMTPRVRIRLEKLLSVTPELNRAVAFWSDQMAEIQLELPEDNASDGLWSNIDKLTPDEKNHTNRKVNNSGWKNLLLWQATGIAGMATSIALALMLFIAPLNDTLNNIPAVNAAPSYMAAMSKHDDSADTIHFVINVYKKTERTPSTLFVQWSQRQPRETAQPLFLWAEDKDTGELTYIGKEPSKGESWDLNKPIWQTISNSSRLLVTQDQRLPSQSNTLFSGPCVQLSNWEKKVI
jgi:hypothetical protein